MSAAESTQVREAIKASIAGIPDHGWQVQLDHEVQEKRGPIRMLRLQQIAKLTPMFVRMFWTYMKLKRQGKKPPIDAMNPLEWKPIYGVPVGGIGCGCINRGWRGDFCRWSLTPGMYTYDIVAANQFSVCIQKNGKTTYAQVLSPSKPKVLRDWNWGYPGDHAKYHALYPRAWTVYELPGQNVTLVCKQISPIFPHDYKDTSLPVGVFIWEVHNNNDEDIDVSIMMTWQNGTGERTDKSGNRWNQSFSCDGNNPTECQVQGMLLHNAHPHMKCTMAISAACKDGIKISYKTDFDPYGDGRELWEDLTSDGELNSTEGPSQKTRKGSATAAAVVAKCHIRGREKTDDMAFCLAWDMPVIQFRSKGKSYSRRYSRWFGNEGNAAPSLSSYALNQYQDWERKIDEWQKPILQCNSLPDWYKSALFNELYYISDGGTVWVEAPDETNAIMNSKEPTPTVVKEYGRFAYLEGHEYRLFNTYDVHFYASFALVMLWPQLQLSLQYDIASTIPQEDTETRTESANGKTMIRKTANSVPHDVGDPEDEPWLRVNAYHFHDTSDWKDLNLKFVLQVYRDYFCMKDMEYLQTMWPQVQAVMTTALSWDTDGDGIIDNSGYADQTYDIWVMTGASAYCGGLWLAALRMTMEMAKVLNQDEEFEKYAAILTKAKESYEKKLWNGKYYNYDSSGRSYSDSIMADQACGHWYLKACDLVKEDDEVFPTDHIQSALKTIYDVNVMGFQQGSMGAVNGMRPDGKVDTTSFQAEEVWSGVTYGLAACMIQEGMLEEAFQSASGVYDTCYQRTGLGFQTPEGYFAKSAYRSLGYMRPLAIWAMQYALEKFGHMK